MMYRFRTVGAWAHSVREMRSRLYPPWVHLDWYWLVQNGESATLVVQASCSVNGEVWMAESRCGSCAVRDEKSLDELLGHVRETMDPPARLLTDAGVLVCQGFLAPEPRGASYGTI